MPGLTEPRTTTQAELTDVTTPHVAADIETDAIETAKIINNAVTLAKLAHGTAGKVIGFDGAGAPDELSAGAGETELIATATGTGETAGTFIATAAIPERKLVVMALKFKIVSTGASSLRIRINGETGNVYTVYGRKVSTGAALMTGSTPQAEIGGIVTINDERTIILIFSTSGVDELQQVHIVNGMRLAADNIYEMANTNQGTPARISEISFTAVGGNFDYVYHLYNYKE